MVGPECPERDVVWLGQDSRWDWRPGVGALAGAAAAAPLLPLVSAEEGLQWVATERGDGMEVAVVVVAVVVEV